MARTRKPKQEYPPNWAEWQWPEATVLAFDQSLANTGWSVVRFSPTAKPRVLIYGTINTEGIEGLAGWHDSLARGEILLREMAAVMTIARSSWTIDAFVHEMPAMMGRVQTKKQEGPAISAMCMRAAARMHQRAEFRSIPIVMMEIHRTKKWLTGDANAEKPAVRAGVFQVVREFRTNEHVADSIALAIAAVAQGDISQESAFLLPTRSVSSMLASEGVE